MAWQRIGDTVNDAPEYMALHELAADRGDDRLVGEIRGYTDMLYTWSAQAFSDYEVPYGAALKIIGAARAPEALQTMEQCGLLENISTEGNRRWRLLKRDSFVHLILRDEKAMKAKRRRDKNKGGLVVPVLLRDGDHCRYCGCEVNWKDNRHDEGGTFDHREPDAETTPENFVVSCRGCNGARFDLPNPDADLPLMDAPEVPVYGDHTRQRLSKWTSVVARTCRFMGIRNPLTGEEAPADLATSQSTATEEPHNDLCEEPTGNQPAGDPRSAAPSASSATSTAAGDDAGTSLPASKAESESPNAVPCDPAGTQPAGGPRPSRDASASAAPGGNGQRRRRRRRRRGGIA